MPASVLQTPTLDEAFVCGGKLVADYHQHRSAYFRSEYSEARARPDFTDNTDKLLMGLGWDVAHNNQHNPFDYPAELRTS